MPVWKMLKVSGVDGFIVAVNSSPHLAPHIYVSELGQHWFR